MSTIDYSKAHSNRYWDLALGDYVDIEEQQTNTSSEPQGKANEPEEVEECYLFRFSYTLQNAYAVSQHYQLATATHAKKLLRDVTDYGLFLKYPSGLMEYFPNIVAASAKPGATFSDATNQPIIVI